MWLPLSLGLCRQNLPAAWEGVASEAQGSPKIYPTQQPCVFPHLLGQQCCLLGWAVIQHYNQCYTTFVTVFSHYYVFILMLFFKSL